MHLQLYIYNCIKLSHSCNVCHINVSLYINLCSFFFCVVFISLFWISVFITCMWCCTCLSASVKTNTQLHVLDNDFHSVFLCADYHEGSLTSSFFSPDDSRVITTSTDRTAKFYDLRSETCTIHLVYANFCALCFCMLYICF